MDAESLELDSGVQGLEMRRQQSLHTINKMAAKVGLVISKYLNIYFYPTEHHPDEVMTARVWCGGVLPCVSVTPITDLS